jgi:hypothetical protein
MKNLPYPPFSPYVLKRRNKKDTVNIWRQTISKHNPPYSFPAIIFVAYRLYYFCIFNYLLYSLICDAIYYIIMIYNDCMYLVNNETIDRKSLGSGYCNYFKRDNIRCPLNCNKIKKE